MVLVESCLFFLFCFFFFFFFVIVVVVLPVGSCMSVLVVSEFMNCKIT